MAFDVTCRIHSALCCNWTECIFTFIDLHLYLCDSVNFSIENSNRKTKHTWQAATSCTNIRCNHLTDFILSFKFYEVIRQNQCNKKFSLPHYHIYSINLDEQTRNIAWHIMRTQRSLLKKLWKLIPVIFTLLVNLGNLGVLVQSFLKSSNTYSPLLDKVSPPCFRKTQHAVISHNQHCLAASFLSDSDHHLPSGLPNVCPVVI